MPKRNLAKKKKPLFRQHDSHKRKGIAKAWRAPKGLQNKVRLSKKGYARSPSVGFGSPKQAKYLTRTGKKLKMIHSIADLDLVGDAFGVVASTIGDRKRMAIAEAAREKKVQLYNMNPEMFLEKLQLKMQARKQEKERKVAGKSQTVKKQEESIEKKLDEEEKKEGRERRKR